MKRDKTRYWAGGLVLLAALLLYLLTLDNGLRPDELTGGDLITHQYAQVEARPSNAPGYPLYTMGGWVWFRVGRSLFSWTLNPIQILSLYSTLWGLASLLILYLILLQIAGPDWLIAPLLTAFYATTFFFWYYSVTTEQYTSAVFQTLLLIWLAFQWDNTRRDSILLWLAFISGALLANMVTTLFILPPLLWFIFFRRERKGNHSLALFSYLKRPKFMLQAVGLALLPLVSYAYIYIRGAQHPEWRGQGTWPDTWSWFVQFLTIQQGRDELAPGLRLDALFTVEFPALMWQELTWPVFLGGLLGLAGLSQRRAIFLASTLVIYLIFCWGYRFGNWFQVIIPAYPIFIIGTAAGLRRISELASRRRAKGAGRPPEARNPRPVLSDQPVTFRVRNTPLHNFAYSPIGLFAMLLLTGLLIYRFSASLPRANQRNLPTDTGLDPGWAILADQPTPPALILSDFAERVALQYLVIVWDAAPLISPIDPASFKSLPDLPSEQTLLYLSRRALALAPEIIQTGIIHPQAAGQQLIALWPEPQTQPPSSASPLQINFGDKLQLLGWEQVETGRPIPPEVARRWQRGNWEIALYWQAVGPLTEDYTISVRPLVEGQLITVAGEALIQDHPPVWGAYPTQVWTPGEIVRDVYALTLPPEMMPDAIQIVVYQATATGFENLGSQTITIP